MALKHSCSKVKNANQYGKNPQDVRISVKLRKCSRVIMPSELFNVPALNYCLYSQVKFLNIKSAIRANANIAYALVSYLDRMQYANSEILYSCHEMVLDH